MLGTRGRAKRVAVRPEAAHGALPPLPLPLVLAVADRLPADDKLRLAFVSPAFRAVADERWLYQKVRLGAGSSVARASDGLLRAISAKARGTMRALDVSGLIGEGLPVVSWDAVTAVCAANADTLEALDVRCKDELNIWLNCLRHDAVALLLASLPRLVWLDADVYASVAQAQALLHHAAVRLRRLIVDGFEDPASVVALVTALTAHPSVKQLGLVEAPLDAAVAMEAVVGFAVERRLGAVIFSSCHLGANSMPALARLLDQGTGLTALTICNDHRWLPVSAAFCAALRACALTRLELLVCDLFGDPSGLALLAAATAHPVLQRLSVAGNWAAEDDESDNDVADDKRTAVGAALGALVGANAALTSLHVSNCDLEDVGLRPLVDALPGNTTLRHLRCDANNVSRPFAASLLAAVRANTSLRTLEADNEADDGDEDEWANGEWHGSHPELAEAEALVAGRAA